MEWTAKIEIRKTEFSAADEARKLSCILSCFRRSGGNLQNDNSGFSAYGTFVSACTVLNRGVGREEGVRSERDDGNPSPLY